MRYMIIRKADASSEASVMPSNDMLMAMATYNTSLADAGVLRDGAGLAASKDGARVHISERGDEPIVTLGPFAETNELIAGYTIIETRDLEEALAHVKRWPIEDAPVTLEVRRYFEMEEFIEGDGIETSINLGNRLEKQPLSGCPYLNFNGNCKEAMAFYAEILGGVVDILDGDAMPDAPEEMKGLTLHAHLKAGAFQLMASDAGPGNFDRARGTSVQLSFADVSKGKSAYDALSTDATEISMPWGETFFAAGFGALVDKFGTPWMIHVEKEMM